MDQPALKPLYWVSSAERDLLELPAQVIDVFGYALYLAQLGRKHDQAKPLRGFGSAGVLEVMEDWHGNTYRAVYTVRFAAGVFVLHVFQKKSRKGRRTLEHDLGLVRRRLSEAEKLSEEIAHE